MKILEKVSVKLSAAFAVLIVLIVILGIFSLLKLETINNDSTVITTNWLPSIKFINNINTGTSDFRIAELQHTLSLTDENMKIFEGDMDRLKKSIQENEDKYIVLISSDKEREMFNKFSDLWGKYLKIHEKFLVLSRANKNEEANNILRGESAKIFNQASDTLVDLIKLNDQGATQQSASGDANYLEAEVWITVVISIAVIISFVLSILIVRSLLRQLGQEPALLANIAYQISKNAKNIDFPGKEKAVGLYLSIIQMHSTLEENFFKIEEEQREAQERTIAAQQAQKEADTARREAENAKREGMLAAAGTIEEIVAKVSQSAHSLDTQIREVSHGSNDQQQLITETSTAMSEMSSTVSEVAQNASIAAGDAETARSQAVSGNEAMDNVEKVINSINDQFLILEKELDGLGVQVGDIHSIMNVISDIADQTNLLALNAAIEAARAGEAGRGFAVVADEVRKLAEKTMSATEEVARAVSAITSSTEKNISHMHKTREEVKNSTEMSKKARDVLEKILEISDRNLVQSQNIATASEEQSNTTEEISRAVMSVNATALQISSAMSEAAQNVGELSTFTRELEDLIVEMKS